MGRAVEVRERPALDVQRAAGADADSSVVGEAGGIRVDEQLGRLIGEDGSAIHEAHDCVADVAGALNGARVGEHLGSRDPKDKVIGIVGQGLSSRAVQEHVAVQQDFGEIPA